MAQINPILTSNRTATASPSRKKVALYARVSSQEQTRGHYPSCESQIEELEAFCGARGWEVFEPIKDEGYRAGTLKRPGLTRLRWMVETEQIDGVVCTWYNRLIGSRDFYVLDKEFKAHNVAFITIHDPADRNTAAGRLLESMLVTIKTFENEQIAEKVRTKMRMRAEKGLWNGGLVPFGFVYDPKTQFLEPDPDKKGLLEQVFQVYVDTQSDFAVRNWFKAHGIPAPNGKAEWMPSTIRDMLMNRRYIAEIEINRDKKGIPDLPEFECYRIVPAPHEPLVPRDLFEFAQNVRYEKALKSPNRSGKGRGQGYSRNQCMRIYPLQGIMVCGICGHAMSPHYVYHKPNPEKGRRSPCYIYHYLCAQQMKYRKACDHSNRILARVPEGWIVDKIAEVVDVGEVLDGALEMAVSKTLTALQPTRDALARCRSALQENERQIDELVDTASSAKGTLLELFQEKAHKLKLERERLRIEQRQLSDKLSSSNQPFSADEYRAVLGDFPLLCQNAQPDELQRLLRLMVRRVEWMPEGNHRVQYYLPMTKQKNSDNDWRNGSRQQRDGQWNL